MGEARQRGTPQERAQAAQQRAAAGTAPRLRCNGCGAELQDVQAVDARALRGIEQAFKAHCSACDRETWAVRGAPASVRAFYAALEKAGGHPVQLGSTG